jgi:hypothetical protein
MHSAISVIVTYGGDCMIRAPTVVRGARTVRAPASTSSGQWKPTEAGRMQSGQIGRSQRVQRINASRCGWR